jgi:DNA polymerase III epsilon subunit-like protein
MIVVDVEATGIDTRKNSIIAIGAIDIANPDRRFYGECRIWEGAHFNPEAELIHGMSLAEVMDVKKQTEAELTRTFLEWSQHMGDRTLAGQNVSFDRDFIKAACERAHLPWDMAHRTIDTHTLCFMHMIKRGLQPPIDAQHRRSALNLDTILLYCGVPEEPKPHNALTGAMCHGEVVNRLLYGRSLLPEFTQYPIPW